MKKFLMAIFATATMAIAGGNIAPVSDTAVIEVVPVQKNWYIGGSTIIAAGDDVESIDWFGFTTVGIQGGYTWFFTNNFETSIEARYSTDTQNFGDDYTYGAFVKPGYDLGGVTAYGLVGYQDGSGLDNIADGELAYGGGVLTDILGLEVFADYLYGDDTKSEVVTVGVNYRF